MSHVFRLVRLREVKPAGTSFVGCGIVLCGNRLVCIILFFLEFVDIWSLLEFFAKCANFVQSDQIK